MRRNWPDLLIGLALVAVIAGIVTTLLTGGSLFPLGGGSQDPDPPPAVTAPPDPAAPDSADPVEPPAEGGLADPLAVPPGAPDPAVDPPVDADAGLAAPPGAPDPDATADADAPDAPAQDAPAAPGAAVSPLAPGDPPAGDPPTVDVPATPAAEDPEPQAAAPEPEPDASPEPAAQPDPTPAATAPSDPYRISVGAFGDAANAERQAERFRADGYPVFLGMQGDLTLVLVGPYVQESQAQSVAAEIRAGDYEIEPVLYVFDPGGPGAAASPAPATASPAPAAPEPADAPEPAEAQDPAPAAPAASANGSLLQVGAFADRASAEPLIERLQGLGFSARPLDEDGLVKLVVGPFAGEALSDARTLLNGAGIEHFAR